MNNLILNPIEQNQPKSTLSEKYAFIDSKQLIEKFTQLDFVPVKQIVTKTKKQENQGYQKHFVEFSHPKFDELKNSLQIDSFPRILLVNSHNGSTGLQLRLGIFRLVCSNGLVVQRGDFGSISIRHSAKALERLPIELTKLSAHAWGLAERVKELSSFEPNASAMNDFVAGALKIRLGDEKFSELKKFELDTNMSQLTTLNRNADCGANAWNYFNRVQENVIRGGRGLSVGGQWRTMRAINSAQSSLEKNIALWELAEKTIFERAA